jgi:hypothetical protein
LPYKYQKANVLMKTISFIFMATGTIELIPLLLLKAPNYELS